MFAIPGCKLEFDAVHAVEALGLGNDRVPLKIGFQVQFALGLSTTADGQIWSEIFDARICTLKAPWFSWYLSTPSFDFRVT